MMTTKNQQRTKYPGVFKDLKSGMFFYQTELGIDRITGKRIRKKARSSENGKPFTTASEANKELTKVKRGYHEVNSYANYKMTYQEFMDKTYIPFYKSDVEESTFETRENLFKLVCKRFGKKIMREITIEDVQNFRTFLLSSVEDGGNGYSQSYASMVFGAFRKTLDKAVEMQYLEQNISKCVKAIPKGRAIVPYWTKSDFEKVIESICIDDFYEHLNFVILWLLYNTGLRVNEAFALFNEDIDLDRKRLRVHHMLVSKSRTDWKRNSYTKTEAGLRTIAIDDDTVSILKKWKERQLSISLGKDNDFVLTYDGLPMVRSTLSQIMKRYSKLAGVKRIQGKGLRHSHASYLINEFNISILILSKRLGHSSPEISLRHYSHMYNGADEQIAEIMSGHIKINTAKESKVEFIGNQFITKTVREI